MKVLVTGGAGFIGSNLCSIYLPIIMKLYVWTTSQQED